MPIATLPTVKSYAPVISIRDEDAAAVLSVVKGLAKSWAENDAETLSGLYAPDATVALPGDNYLKGRPAIRDWMENAFNGKWKGTQVLGIPLELRYLADNVILMFSHGGAHQPGATEVSVDDSIRGLWVFVKQESGWTIAAYENTPVRAIIPVPGTPR